MEIFEWTAVQTSIINISQLSWWPDSDLPFRKTNIESLPTSFFDIGFQNIKTDIWKHHEQTVWSLTKKCHVSRSFFSARPLVAPPAFRAGSPPPAAGPGSPPVPVPPAVTPAVPQVPPGSPMPLGVLRSWENMENGLVFSSWMLWELLANFVCWIFLLLSSCLPCGFVSQLFFCQRKCLHIGAESQDWFFSENGNNACWVDWLVFDADM